jgi:hypothetical protein
MPLRMAGHMRRIEVRRSVAGVARQRRGAVAIGAAHDQRLMRSALISLARAVARGMTVHAARMLQHLAGFLDQRSRTRVAIGNAGKVGGRAQVASSGLRTWLRLCVLPRDGQGRSHQSCGENRDTFVHHTVPRTIGKRRGRPRPRRAMAFATAGPMGGTPGSPTPVGFSVEGRIVTSTSGISWMRNER